MLEYSGAVKIFKRRLEAVNPPLAGRRWLFVPYDQLSDRLGPLGRNAAPAPAPTAGRWRLSKVNQGV